MTTLPQLLAVVIPLAIASMISPLAIITVMTVLSSEEHRLKKGVIFVATYCIVFSLICLIFVAIGSLTTTGGKPSLATVAIDFILGLLLLYASARSLLKKGGSNTFDATAMGAGGLISMGIGFGFGNIFSSLPALAASKDIGVVVLSLHDKAIAFVLVMAITLCWLWGPLAVFAAAPRSFDRIFDPITRFLKKHGSQIIAAVFFLVGIFLVARGVTSAMML
jgi:small neutral amino acid transporter SnatA (MarC family)